MNPKNINLKYNAEGIALTKDSEGERLTAYRDSRGILTIGVGHTFGVIEGMTITSQQSTEYLLADIYWAENVVKSAVDQSLTQNQFDALVDFVFNIGVGNFTKSTLLKLLNDGKLEEADQEFKKWDLAGGKVLKGLEERRANEAALFSRV